MEQIHKLGGSEVMEAATKKLDDMNNDYNNLHNEFERLQEANNKLQKHIAEKEDDYTNLDYMTKKHQDDFNNLTFEYAETNQKLQEMKNELEERANEIDELNKLKNQAEKKVDEETTIRKNTEERFIKIKDDYKRQSKDHTNTEKRLRKEKLKGMTIATLKPMIKDKSKIENFQKNTGKNLNKPDVLEMIYEQEGLNEDVFTPTKTPIKLEPYLDQTFL